MAGLLAGKATLRPTVAPEGGLRLRLPGGGLKAGVSVNVRIEQFGFAEYGIVRYALGRGIVGIEFRFEMDAKGQIERWKKISSIQTT